MAILKVFDSLKIDYFHIHLIAYSNSLILDFEVTIQIIGLIIANKHLYNRQLIKKRQYYNLKYIFL